MTAENLSTINNSVYRNNTEDTYAAVPQKISDLEALVIAIRVIENVAARPAMMLSRRCMLETKYRIIMAAIGSKHATRVAMESVNLRILDPLYAVRVFAGIVLLRIKVCHIGINLLLMKSVKESWSRYLLRTTRSA